MTVGSKSGSRETEQIIGIDVGGTTIKAGVVRDATAGLAVRRPTPDDPASLVETIAALVQDLVPEADTDVAAIGVAVPGIVQEEDGLVRRATSLGWRDVPLRDLLQQRLQRPVAVGHDVRCGALAEYQVRAGQGTAARGLVFLPIGTGIAAACVLDGVAWTGDGFAGEIGHVPIGPVRGRVDPCPCGLHGCLETVAGARGIVRRYDAASGASGSVGAASEVLRRAGAGDAVAAEVWEDACVALATGIAWLNAVLAPEVVLLGGGVSLAGDRLLGPVTAALRARTPEHARTPMLALARLGDEAGWRGAALLAERSSHGATA